jgi:thiamine-phosphate pyrophosphorylase
MKSQAQELWRQARRLGRNAAPRKPLPPLLFFTDPGRTPDASRTVAAMARGSGVVYRAFGAANALREGLRVRAAARRAGVLFIVGADAGLASRLDADGLHLPERLGRRAGVIRALSRRFLVTAAAHSLPAALAARRAGARALIISPVFASISPSAGRPLGPRSFAVMARKSGLPAYALGGVNARTARALSRSGAAGLAMVEGAVAAFGPAD